MNTTLVIKIKTVKEVHEKVQVTIPATLEQICQALRACRFKPEKAYEVVTWTKAQAEIGTLVFTRHPFTQASKGLSHDLLGEICWYLVERDIISPDDMPSFVDTTGLQPIVMAQPRFFPVGAAARYWLGVLKSQFKIGSRA